MVAAYTRELIENSTMPERWFWLSFASNGKATGVIITRGRFLLEAVMRTHAHGINPGGSIFSQEVPATYGDPRPEDANRLISDPEEITAVAMAWIGCGTESAEENIKRCEEKMS